MRAFKQYHFAAEVRSVRGTTQCADLAHSVGVPRHRESRRTVEQWRLRRALWACAAFCVVLVAWDWADRIEARVARSINAHDAQLNSAEFRTR
jgi:hypothetical protein